MHTLLFDFDGTIADSFGVVVDIFYELTGHEQVDQDEVKRLRQLPLLKVVRALHISPLQVPGLVMRGRKMMHDRLDEIPVFKGVPEMLQELQNSGHQMYMMSSNSQQNVRRFLRTHDLDQYFSGVYGGVGLFGKANALRHIMRQNGLKPEDCSYVGDEARDVEGAKKAGVQSIAVGWGYNDAQLLSSHEPDALVMRPAEILTIMTEQEQGDRN